jgi:hypothetical protein
VTGHRSNRCINAILVVLLCAAIFSLSGPQSDHRLDIRTWVHAVLGVLLTLAVLVHIALHRRWFKPVLALRAKRSTIVKSAVFGCITLVMLLAFFSEFIEIASPSVNVLHHVSGLLALLGLPAHTIKRLVRMHKTRPLRHLALDLSIANCSRRSPIPPADLGSIVDRGVGTE